MSMLPAPVIAASPSSTGGSYSGVAPPKFITGQTYLPTGFSLTGGTIATTLNDLFYYPFYVDTTQAFSGARTYNQGAADNGKLIRLGVYDDKGTNGGPGTLIKDFGAITLTGAAALRTLASAVTLSGPSWYWMAQACQAYSAFGMTSLYLGTAVGIFLPGITSRATGITLSVVPLGTVANAAYNVSQGLYVSTAYGAFASTAVAPTSELSRNYTNSVNATNEAPLMGLYV